MHVDDLEECVSEALAREGRAFSKRVVLEGATGHVYAQDFHVEGPPETMVQLHAEGPADADDVGRFHDAVRDVGADAGLLVCPEGFTPDVEPPPKLTLWDVHDLEEIMDRDLSWTLHPAADEPRGTVMHRLYNETHERPEGDVEPRLRAALGSAEALISCADGILAGGPVTEEEADALEGFSRMLESLDDDKETSPAWAREEAEPPDDTVFDQGGDDPDTREAEPPDGTGLDQDADDAGSEGVEALPAPSSDDVPEDGFLARAMDLAADADPDPGAVEEGPPEDEGGPDAAARRAEPNITASQATNLVAGLVHGPMEATLEHQPCYMYAYRLKMEDESNGHRDTGRLWVHSGTLSVREVPDDVTFGPGDVGHPAQRESKARERAMASLRERSARRTKVVRDDENVTLVEERDVRADPGSIDLELDGVVGRPFWRIEGKNGDVLLDALVGEVVEEHLDDVDTGDGDFMVA